MTKAYLKPEAILLRQEGYSYELIKNKIGVSKSTLSDWLSKIPLIPNKETLERMSRGRMKAARTATILKQKRINESHKIATSELGQITKRDLMLLGVGLYIGEGGKYDKGFIQFSNSDPKVIKLAMNWFLIILKIKPECIYLRLHIYPDNDIKECLNYWSKLIKIPTNQFGKIYVDNRTNKAIKNKRKLPYGTLHIRIRNLDKKYERTNLYQKILKWIEIVENNNFAGIV